MIAAPFQTHGTRRACWPVAGGLAAVVLTVAQPVAAQVIPTGTPAADILLSRALADQQLFLTCSALEADTHARIVESWQKDATAAIALMTARKVPAEAITAFTGAAAVDALLLPPDTPFDEVRQFCDNRPDWLSRWTASDYTRLSQSLPQVLP